LSCRDDVLSAFSKSDGRNRVYKAAYSRFATQTIVRPKSVQALGKVEPTARKPWLAQEFLPGRPIATFSVAHRGRLTAHAAYAGDLSLGFGPSAAYRPLIHPAAFKWVQSFVQAMHYTGQLGIDFIEDEQGGVSAIEGNPRMTGGVFLLKDHPEFTAAYFEPETETIFPTSDRAYTFRVALLLTLLLRRQYFPGMREWARVFFRGRGTNPFLLSDPIPCLAGPLIQQAFIWRCIRQRRNVRRMAAQDFEWSEDPRQPLAAEADDTHAAASSKSGRQIVDTPSA
jgi:hypothetical protein